jgi:hypothetical protein
MGLPTGNLPQKHEVGFQDRFILSLQAFGASAGSPCNCSLRQHVRKSRLIFMFLGVLTVYSLGGGSSINFLMYTRASASDYDDFKTPGWTTKELLPLMKKVRDGTMRVRYYDSNVLHSSRHTSDLATTARSTDLTALSRCLLAITPTQ